MAAQPCSNLSEPADSWGPQQHSLVIQPLTCMCAADTNFLVLLCTVGGGRIVAGMECRTNSAAGLVPTECTYIDTDRLTLGQLLRCTEVAHLLLYWGVLTGCWVVMAACTLQQC